MNRKLLKNCLCLMLAISAVGCSQPGSSSAAETPAAESTARSVLFDDDWRFLLGDENGAEQTNFDDSSWRSLSLPHDWSIEQTYTVSAEAESGFLPGGTGWYRKSFVLGKEYASRQVSITFEGVYMNATVYLNGQQLGTHPYGYTSFSFDLSNQLICDGSTENVLAVKVENTLPNSRWYSGSGIYRDVWLTATDAVHIQENGIQVTSPQLESEQNGAVSTVIAASVINEGSQTVNASVHSIIYDADGGIAAECSSQEFSLSAGEQKTVTQNTEVSQPVLWSLTNPTLYTVKTEILVQQTAVDTVSTAFGYRYFHFDADTGFSLNGEAMKLKGVCLHQDHGSLGTVTNRRAIQRQLEQLKDMGCNAIRSTHHPASSTLLQLCSEMGILVIDESFDTWTNPKNYNLNDYSQVFNTLISSDNQIAGGSAGMTWAEYDSKNMVLQARNNPAVILWSIGNEVLGNIGGDTSAYPADAAQLAKWISETDSTRPVTIGDNKLTKQDATQAAIDQAIMNSNGVIGLNYAIDEEYDQIHSQYPAWPLYGSETASAMCSRGIYTTLGVDAADHLITSYDNVHAEWGSSAAQAWQDVITRDFVAGEFIWTGFDYLGEPEPWNGLGTGSVTDGTPSPKSSYFGVLDTAGFAKDSYYLYQSLWNDQVTTLHILPCWNEDAIDQDTDGNVEVVVDTNAPSVELFLNGKSLGRQSAVTVTTAEGYSYQTYSGQFAPVWHVAYQAGTLSAKAYDQAGNEITETSGRSSVTTSGKAAKLRLSADRTEISADGKDLCYVTVEVLDADDNPVPNASQLIHFSLSGAGRIAGVDNGDATDLSSYQGSSDTEAQRKAFSGKALAILQAADEAGSITLSAAADGLAEASVEITTVSAADSAGH